MTKNIASGEYLIKSFFPESLVEMGRRQIPAEADEQAVLLDKNELPYEIPFETKEKIINELKYTNWNRYPSPYYPVIEEYIAEYAGVNSSNIVLGIGAAQLINMLFNLFSGKNLIITHPSFSLFEFLCRGYSISYKPWNLDENFEYSLSNLPEIKNETVVVLSSPNNPTGTIIDKSLLEPLLTSYPNTLFIIDEVYSEFCKITHKEFIKKYPNLILIRSFSKAFGLAGVRSGYLMCPDALAGQIRKIVLPFVLNHFSEITLKTILTDNDLLNDILNKIDLVIEEREKIYSELKDLEEKHQFRVFKSYSNFILIQFKWEADFMKYLFQLKQQQIHVLNLSHIPELKNSLRISIGNPGENKQVLNCLKKC